MRKLFSIFLLLNSFAAFATKADTTYYVDVCTDSIVNEHLYFITGKVLQLASERKIFSYDLSGNPAQDSAVIASWMQRNTVVPLPSAKLKRLRVAATATVFSFAPDNGSYSMRNIPAPRFLLSEIKPLLPDSDFVYLENALVHHKTKMLYRRVLDITANENFEFSFNHPQEGVSTRLKNMTYTGSFPAYFNLFDSTRRSLGHPSNCFYTAPKSRNWLFGMQMMKSDVRAVYYHELKYEESPEYMANFKAEIAYSYFQFIFLADYDNGKIIAGENNLIALGPVNADSLFLKYPLVWDYREVKQNMSVVQRKIIDDYIRGNPNQHAVRKFSESAYRIDPKNDTALIRIVEQFRDLIAEKHAIPVFADSLLRVRLTLSETQYRCFEKKANPEKHDGYNDEFIPDTSRCLLNQVFALNIVRYWHRSDQKEYENESHVFALAPLVKDKSGKLIPLFYIPFNSVLFEYIGKADLNVLIDFISRNSQTQTARMHITQEGKMTDGKSLFVPLNLFDSYRTGDSLDCTFLFLDSPSALPFREIYITKIGKEKKHEPVSSAALIPFYVNTISYSPGYSQWGGTPKEPGLYYNSGYGYGYCDTSGHQFIAPQFELAYLFSEGRARVGNRVLKNNEQVWLYTFIDSTGRTISECKFYRARDFHEGRAAVMIPEGDANNPKNFRWGFVDAELHEITHCIYYEVREFKNGFAAVRDNSGWHFIDKNGNTVGGDFTALADFENEIARVSSGGKSWGMLNAAGKLIVPCLYDTICEFSSGMALVKKDGLVGFMNEKGKLVIPFKYEAARSFSEGLIAVKQNGKWGFVNAKGKTKIPFQYENAAGFSDGLAAVKQNGKWGFIDPSGKVKIKFSFDSTGNFTHGLVAVSNTSYAAKSWFVIDKNGKAIVPENPFDRFGQIHIGTDGIIFASRGFSAWPGPSFLLFSPEGSQLNEFEFRIGENDFWNSDFVNAPFFPVMGYYGREILIRRDGKELYFEN